jgi:hypothetical protein
MRNVRPTIPRIVKHIEAIEASVRSGSTVNASAASRLRRRDMDRMQRLITAGELDIHGIEQAARASVAERRKLVEGARQRAIAGSSAASKRLAALAKAATVKPTTPTEPWQPGSFILEDATFVRSWPNAGDVSDSSLGNDGNFAEYKMHASADFVGTSDAARLSFYFLWENPRTEDIFANVAALLMVNAHLTVNADWNGVAAWFIGDSHASATVRARVSLWPLWTQSAPVIISDQVLASTTASGGFFGGSNDTSVEFSQLSNGAGFIVPAGRFLLIEVSLVTEWSANGGSIDLDASSGAFQVGCPAAIVTIPSGLLAL